MAENYPALNSIANELESKHLTREAQVLRDYLAKHADSPAFRQLDAWLTKLAAHSPETIQHIKRVAVVAALNAPGFTQGMSDEARADLTARVIIAAAAHDIGKLEIDPKLLEKSSRVDPDQIKQLMSRMPDYPGKAQDVEFLNMINGGWIAFDKEDKPAAVHSLAECISIVRNDPTLSEPRIADADLKSSNLAHFNAIKERAEKAGVAWLPKEMEDNLLNRGFRGTLTEKEIAVMAKHDPIGKKMFLEAGLDKALGLPADIIQMNKDGRAAVAADPEMAKIHEWISLADKFEAMTGQRAYNRENGKEYTIAEAMRLLEKAGVDPAILQQFKDSGVAETYGKHYGIPQERGQLQPDKPQITHDSDSSDHKPCRAPHKLPFRPACHNR